MVSEESLCSSRIDDRKAFCAYIASIENAVSKSPRLGRPDGVFIPIVVNLKRAFDELIGNSTEGGAPSSSKVRGFKILVLARRDMPHLDKKEVLARDDTMDKNYLARSSLARQ